MTLPVETDWARGINGIEVDPDFNDNGYIYVSYIGADNIQRLSRFTVTDPTADVLTADPTTELVLLEGDRAGGERPSRRRDPLHRRQSSTGQRATTSAAAWSTAAIRRISPTSTARSCASIRTAQCPPTTRSTYVPGRPKGDLRDWACVTRSEVASRPTASCCIGDVGQNTWEEINLVSAGANFGWPYAEGVCPGPGVCKSGSDGTTKPIYAYQHEGVRWVVDHLGSGLRGRRIRGPIRQRGVLRRPQPAVREGDEMRRGLHERAARRQRSSLKRVARPGWHRRQTAASIN